MNTQVRFIWLLALLSCVGPAVASSLEIDRAQALIDEYSKSEVIRSVLKRCVDAHVTVSDSEGLRQVLGRPSEDLINAETIAHDIQRCGGSSEEIAQELRRTKEKQREAQAASRRAVERYESSPRIQELRAEATDLVAESRQIRHQYYSIRANSRLGQPMSQRDMETLKRLRDRMEYLNRRVREVAAEAHALPRLNYLTDQ